MAREGAYHQTVPNSDFYSKNRNALYLHIKELEIPKFRRAWPLEMLRHTPIALGASGASGVGLDTPRSIKIGHAPVAWGTLRRNRPKPKCAWSREQEEQFWHGGASWVFSDHARPTPAFLCLVDITTHMPRRRHFIRNVGMRDLLGM
jgi:hypothetical protein